MDEIITRVVDMPTEIKGITILDDEGNYNVYINDRLSHDMRHEVYEHEIAHIKRNDFHRDVDIRVKEQDEVANTNATTKKPDYQPTEHEKLKWKKAQRNWKRRSKEIKDDIRAQLHAMSRMQRYNFFCNTTDPESYKKYLDIYNGNY